MGSDTLPPITLADYDQLRFIGSAQLSPDGRFVAMTVLQAVGERDEITLWLLDVVEGGLRRLTAYDQVLDPCWSPDGRSLAFRAYQDGAFQLCVLALDEREARQVTHLPQGVDGGPVWSPDGQWLAFTAGPDQPAFDPRLPYRVTRSIYRFDNVGYTANAVQHVYLVAPDGNHLRQLTHEDAVHGSLVWSPDSQQILLTAVLFPDTYLYNPELKVVNLAGELRTLVREWGFVETANWLPDGRRLVFCGQPHGRRKGDKNDLWLLHPDGQIECRSAACPYHLLGNLQKDMPTLARTDPVIVRPDGVTAVIQAQIGGTLQLVAFSLEGEPSWQTLAGGDRACYLQNQQADSLLFVVSDLFSPSELVLWHNGQERSLTQLNTALFAARALPRLETFQFPSEDGVLVEGWLLRPPVRTDPAPTIIDIHGGPHSGYGHVFAFNFHLLAGAGYAVLFLNHRGSTGYGEAFANAALGDWGHWDYADVMAGVDFAIAQGWSDPGRLGVTGLSAGGFLTCWIVGHTHRFQVAVAQNPVTNWVSFYGTSDIGTRFALGELNGRPHEIPETYQRCSPITTAHLCRTPTLLIVGESDHRCPPEQAEQFYTALRVNECPVEMLRLPQAYHQGAIRGSLANRHAENEALLGWMNQFLQK